MKVLEKLAFRELLLLVLYSFGSPYLYSGTLTLSSAVASLGSSSSQVPGGLVTKSCLTLVIPWPVALQVPLSRRAPRQEYWIGLSLPSPGDLPDPGIEPRSPALQTDSLLTEVQGNPSSQVFTTINFSLSSTSTVSHTFWYPSWYQYLIMKGEINCNTIRVGNFSTPLLPMDRSSR